MTAIQASNEEIVVAIALDVLAGKGWFAEEPDDELVAELRRLYGAHPVCQLEVQFTGEVLHDMLAARPGEYLAGFYEQERQEAWERTVPTWTCDCGQAFKVLPDGTPGRPDDRFYRIVEDGLLGQLAGTIRGTGISHNKACPDCRREFAMTLKLHADPQLRLFVEVA
jgi:hypothetical protein